MQFDTSVVFKDAWEEKNDERIALCPYNGGRGVFFITASWVISWFIKIDLKQIYCNYPCSKKIQDVLFKNSPIIGEVNIVTEHKQTYW